MSIKINSAATFKDNTHDFKKYCAFLDDDGDFWLINQDTEIAIRLADKGCYSEDITEYDSIEDFLGAKFGCNLIKAYTHEEYSIEVTC